MSHGLQGTIIEDIFSPSTSTHAYQSNQQFPQSSQQYQQYEQYQQSQQSQHMQLPQPLKSVVPNHFNVMASTNTHTQFNHHVGGDSIGSSAFQSNAIRGKVTNPVVYHWNANPNPNPANVLNQTLQPTPSQWIQQAPAEGYSMYPSQPFSQASQQFSTMYDSKQMLRDAIIEIYRNTNCMKTHIFGIYSVFKAPVEGLTGGVFKYIVAIVPGMDHIQLGQSVPLNQLQWISFQTRQTENPAAEFGEIRPKPTQYSCPMDSKHFIYSKINMVLNDSNKFVYLAENLPFKIELLKLKDSDVAAEKATLMGALDAFKTVITFLDS